MAFDQRYWKENYAQPKTMDGIGNAKQHVQYIKAFFELEKVDISSVADFGFGLGYLFQKALKAFLPYKALGLEPSAYAFEKATKRKLCPVPSTKLRLINDSLQNWCALEDHKKLHFDLGIATSVFQYIGDDDLKRVLEVLARRVKYLYITVPTDKELDRQVEELNFHDRYALRRTRDYYQETIGRNYTNIAGRIWESKFFFDEETTLFTDLLYRR